MLHYMGIDVQAKGEGFEDINHDKENLIYIVYLVYVIGSC